MKRFVSIWFPYLITDWFALQKPELRNIPFVVKAPSRGRMIIVAANPLAQRQGINEQMTLADARAVHPNLVAVDERPGLAGKLYKRIAEWCIRFTPVAAVDPLGGIILDASGCAHLWGGEAVYLKDLLKRIHHKGYYAKAAMADTIGAAWAATRFTNDVLLIEPGKHSEILMDLSPACLRLERPTVERLDKLGLYHVKDLVSIPKTALRRRFGSHIVKRLGQAFGKEQEFIEGVQPVEPYQERLPCFEPIARREGIEIAVARLLDSLCIKLGKEGKGLRVAQLDCYRVDGKQQKVQISTSVASNNAKHLFHLFGLKLGDIEPDLGIELFVLTAGKTEDHTPRQQAFWKEAKGLNETSVAEFIDRISTRIGTNAIQRYLPAEHYLPEKSYRAASALKEEVATGWYIDRPRPIQLLPMPEVIEVTAPIPDYPPMNFRYKGKLHTIKKADGPERIEQEWWIKDGRHRDYYAVEDEEGCRYWLFRSGHYDAAKTYKWYLHGFFA
jgi:protein ImuB